MRIVLIGAGNVATHLAVALKNSGNDIIQIFSKTLDNAQLLASLVNAEPVNDLKSIQGNADLYIFSVKDDVLNKVVESMSFTDGIWAHTSGSLPMNILLSNKSEGHGVIYPLQTFSKQRKINLNEVPIFVEGDKDQTVHFLENIAKSISNDVRQMDSERRRYLHLAAVFTNNFSNHMFTLASEILKNEDIPFEILKPLIRETAAKVMEMEPINAQTGPAVRYDESVIQKHIELIEDSDLILLYELLSKSINKYSK